MRIKTVIYATKDEIIGHLQGKLREEMELAEAAQPAKKRSDHEGAARGLEVAIDVIEGWAVTPEEDDDSAGQATDANGQREATAKVATTSP